MSIGLEPPFPYYGRKVRWARTIWDRLGNPDVYVEPCGGSLAALLARPTEPRSEVACDTSGHICNFFRAIKQDPDGLARAADNPTIDQDLIARHRWLIRWGLENAGRLLEDPGWYDLKAAGWWAWGASSWVGSGWCLLDEDKRPKVPDGGGQGIQAQRVGLPGEVGTGERLQPMFRALARRLSRVVILNRDWTSAVTPTVLRRHRNHNPSVSVFMDPPYRTEHRNRTLYQSDLDGTSDGTAQDTWEWSKFMGERYRIAYACREGDVEPPGDWEVITMEFPGVKNPENRESSRDMVLFSPTCIVPQPSLFGPDF